LSDAVVTLQFSNTRSFLTFRRIAPFVTMLVRSPRRLAFLSFVAFVCIIAVLQQSPWASTIVYEQLPLFHGSPSYPTPSPDSSPTPSPDSRPSSSPNSSLENNPNVASGRPLDQEVVDAELNNAAISNKPSPPPWTTASSKPSPLDYSPPRPTNLKEYMKEMLNWRRPSWEGHWPPFVDYVDKEYDPNRWEEFEM